VDEIPASVSFEHAAFFLLGQTAGFVTGLADIQPGDAVAIVGQGPIGNLAVQFAREAQAARIVALDLVESRRGMARAAGATDALDPADDEALSHLLAESGGFNKTIDLSGSSHGTDLAIRLAGPLGTVILSTGFGGHMDLDYGSIFMKGLHLIGGFVNSRPDLARSATRDYLRLLSEGRIDISSLVRPAFAPAQAPTVFSRVLERDRSLVAPLFDWREA
jgi:threonine dehydrogenase-like Zn-dependent dehydrogenase